MSKTKKKLGIIIPYRDRRNHLKQFIRMITNYMINKDIPYHIFVIEQDFAKLFNRGALLNIGYKYAKKNKCNYVVFHDVDMLPVHVDYSYSEIPLQLANNFISNSGEIKNELFDEYFGGVTMFPNHLFEVVDGYSNKYWGWGYEDTDLLHRCIKNGIDLDTLKIKNMGKPQQAIKFNGVNAFVKGKNVFNVNNDITFFVSFYPNDTTYDFNKDVDEYNVFTIPGYDLTISYNSFSRYNFCTFDNENEVLYVNSSIKTNYKTNITVSIDNTNKNIKVYQDGNFIGNIEFDKKLRNYNLQKYFYLGAGEPDRLNKDEKIYPKYFDGYITCFAAFNTVLNDDEIKEISINEHLDFNDNFGNYKSNKDLILYYDSTMIENYQLIDLTGRGNNGMIVNCEIVDLDFPEYKEIKVPFKRISTFSLIKHTENGFYRNKWKTQATRWNQLRFNNEVKKNNDLIENDGLSTLEFIEYGIREINDKITHINVGL